MPPIEKVPAPGFLLGIAEISAYLQLGPYVTRRLIDTDRTFPSFRLGESGQWMARASDLQTWAANRPKTRRRRYTYADE